MNNVYKTIIFLVLKKEKRKRILPLPHIQISWKNGIIKPESRQEPNYTWFCGSNEFGVYVKDKLATRRISEELNTI